MFFFEVNEVSKNSWNHNSQKLDDFFLEKEIRKKRAQSLFCFVMTMLVLLLIQLFFFCFTCTKTKVLF